MKPSEKEMGALRLFVPVLIKAVAAEYNISKLIVDENPSVGGPMTFVFTLALSEDMPHVEDLKVLCEELGQTRFPFIYDVPEREVGCFTIAVDYSS